jgi:hypothetical protein
MFSRNSHGHLGIEMRNNTGETEYFDGLARTALLTFTPDDAFRSSRLRLQ